MECTVDENKIYINDRVYSWINLINKYLPVVTYTLKCDISKNSIEVVYISDNFQDVVGCNVEEFKNYRKFCENIDVKLSNFFGFLKNVHDQNNFFEKKYSVKTSFGGCNIILDCAGAKRISKNDVIVNGILFNVTCTEINDLALSISEERLRVALEASGAGFFDWEIGSPVIFCDETTKKLFGIKSNNLILRDFLRVIDFKDLKHYFTVLRSLFYDGICSFHEDVFVNSQWLCISGRVIEKDDLMNCPRRIAGTVRDITSMKNALLERERMNELLEERVRERTERLEAELATKIVAEKQLIDNLERERELNITKSIFVNMVSHEFRTPLAIIQSSVDLMQTYFDKLSKADIDSSLSSINNAVWRMTKTMDDILLLGKVQTSQIQFTPSMTDVLYLCSAVAEELECTLALKRIIIETTPNVPRLVFVDASLIEHIISNLLSNALKYSDDDKKVVLKIDYQHDNLTFYVSDHGIGIPKQDFNLLFKLFKRGSNVSNKRGIGVGMFIVKYCVDLHHGTISFKSKEGVGTTFKVILPAGKEEVV